MVDLLVQIRTALDELTPLLHHRIVDIEMPRLTVVADASTLQRALVAVIGRAVEHSEGLITVRTVRQGTVARIEVTGEHPHQQPPAASASGWSATLAGDVEAIDGRLGEGDAALVWLTVPLSGPSAPES
jgi:hypothetical protein